MTIVAEAPAAYSTKGGSPGDPLSRYSRRDDKSRGIVPQIAPHARRTKRKKEQKNEETPPPSALRGTFPRKEVLVLANRRPHPVHRLRLPLRPSSGRAGRLSHRHPPAGPYRSRPRRRRRHGLSGPSPLAPPSPKGRGGRQSDLNVSTSPRALSKSSRKASRNAARG